MPLQILRNGTQRWAPQRGAYILGGKYQLEKPIGEGGMGSVWRAHQVALQRPVAVKFVKVDEPHMVERFLRETRVAASIRNPHVIDMLDFGTTPTGQPVLVMELLEGESLEDVLMRRVLTVREVVSVMTQVLIALEAVHSAGMVHGDLKPANVFLSHDGTEESFVRLIDFGIAYSLDPASNLRRGRNGTDLRTICGTPEYMAPELAECLPDVDARADVYGAGVMLYELFAGVLPFEAEHSGATLFKVMDGKYVPLVALRPDIPALAAIVTSAMARDRADRPQTAHALRILLLESMSMISGAFSLLAKEAHAQEKAATSARQQLPTLPEMSPSPWSAQWIRWALASVILGGITVLGLLVSYAEVPLLEASAPVEVPAASPLVVPAAPARARVELEIVEPEIAPVIVPSTFSPDAAPTAEAHRVRVPMPVQAEVPEPPRPRAPGLRRDLDF
jgi:serine/threonine-protein kinase